MAVKKSRKSKNVKNVNVKPAHIVFEGKKVWYFIAFVIVLLLVLFLVFIFNLRSEAVVGNAVKGMNNVCIFKCT